MKPLVHLALWSIGLINASFVGVVTREVAGSDLAGGLAALMTVVAEFLLVRQVRAAMSRPQSESSLSTHGGRA